MCEPVKVTAGAVLASMLCNRAGATMTAVAGSGVALYAMVGGSTVLAVTFMGLVACAAISTIALIVVVSRPTRPVIVQQRARVQTRAPMRVIASGPAVAPGQAVAALTATTLNISDVVTPGARLKRLAR